MAFLSAEYNRVGADTHITPREIIRDFIEFLNILYQNPSSTAQEILGSSSFVLLMQRRRRNRFWSLIYK